MKSAKKKVGISTSSTETKKLGVSLARIPYRWVHIMMVLLIYMFCTCVYGDVFQRAQQDCYVSTNAEYMTYLLRLPLGQFYWVMRFFMLVFKNVWLGGAVMTILLVGSACCLSKTIGLSRQWKLLAFLLPMSVLYFFVWRGVRLYFLDEPSLVLGVPVVLFILMALATLVSTFFRKINVLENQKFAHWISVLIILIASAVLVGSVYAFRENDVVCARMQNRMLKADWEGIVDDALSVKRGSRPIAAYYAIALFSSRSTLKASV